VRVCVLGAGGLGSVLGAGLADAGHDVTLVARPAHVAAIRAGGLVVEGRGPRVVRDHLAAVAHPDEVAGDVDLLVLLVKARDTDTTLAAAVRLRDRVGLALSLQNSVTKDDRLSAWLDGDRVLGAATTEAATLVRPGVVRHTATAPTSVYVGELHGPPSTRAADVADALSGAGFATRVAVDVRHVEWEKLLQVSVVAAFSVTTTGSLPDGSVAAALRLRAGAEHWVQLGTELLAVYRGLGYEPEDFFAPFARFRELASSDPETAVVSAMALGEAMWASGAVGRPSLHDDLLRGRPTELDESLGTYLAAADRLGLAVPTARAAHRTIRVLEQLVTEPPRPALVGRTA
jgi:2-dehydropantoate 2-reductase